MTFPTAPPERRVSSDFISANLDVGSCLSLLLHGEVTVVFVFTSECHKSSVDLCVREHVPGSINRVKMMGRGETRMSKMQKMAESPRLSEQKPSRPYAQGPVQAVAPQVAYRRVQLNRDGLRPPNLLALQRAGQSRGAAHGGESKHERQGENMKETLRARRKPNSPLAHRDLYEQEADVTGAKALANVAQLQGAPLSGSPAGWSLSAWQPPSLQRLRTGRLGVVAPVVQRLVDEKGLEITSDRIEKENDPAVLKAWADRENDTWEDEHLKEESGSNRYPGEPLEEVKARIAGVPDYQQREFFRICQDEALDPARIMKGLTDVATTGLAFNRAVQYFANGGNFPNAIGSPPHTTAL